MVGDRILLNNILNECRVKERTSWYHTLGCYNKLAIPPLQSAATTLLSQQPLA